MPEDILERLRLEYSSLARGSQREKQAAMVVLDACLAIRRLREQVIVSESGLTSANLPTYGDAEQSKPKRPAKSPMPRFVKIWRQRLNRTSDPIFERHACQHWLKGERSADCYDCTETASRKRDTLMGSPDAVKVLWDLCHRTPLRKQFSDSIVELS